MFTLFLDFGSHDHLIALIGEQKVENLIRLENHTDDSTLMPTLQKLLEASKLTLNDLTHIAAVTGPGGFMSLRVGISLANALSWSLKIPIAGVHLSDLCAERTQSSVWLHSTKKNFLFIRGFGELRKLWPEPILMSIEDAQKQIPSGTSFVGELIEEHQKALPQVKPAQATQTIEKVLPAFIQTLKFEMKPLEPWYGREG